MWGEHFLAELPPSNAFHFLNLQGWEVTKLVADQTMNEQTTTNKQTNKQTMKEQTNVNKQ